MKALFLGEGVPDGSARYLHAILTWSKIPFDHLSDQQKIPKSFHQKTYDVILVSDYRYTGWTPGARKWVTRAVRAGTGFIMLGGWASFTGLVGRYAGTAIENLLPVRCLSGDDRINRPAVLTGSRNIPVVVNGYHRVRPKPGSQTHLSFRDLRFSRGKVVLGPAHPALVTGLAGRGRTLAFMTDCAPHWAGGLIDWGKKRIRVPVRNGGVVEVGETYLTFFKKWILWAAQRPGPVPNGVF